MTTERVVSQMSPSDLVVVEEGEEAVRERKDVGEAVGQRNLHEGHRLEHLQVPT